jgi:peptide/nickel transport system permease protein
MDTMQPSATPKALGEDAMGWRGVRRWLLDRWEAIRMGRLAFLFESWTAAIGLSVVIFWILVAILAPVLAPYGPNEVVGKLNQPPSLEYLMGTDHLGRDVFSRLLFGSRPILVLAPFSVACAMAVGITLGLTAGFFGGVVDEVIMRILDAVMAFPTLLLYMIVIAAIGASRLNVVLAITIGGTPGITRILRSLVLEIRNREFVQAARLRGESSLYIMFREILPNCMGPLIVDACLRIGYAAFAIGGLGFLGLGLPPPDPDWGRMVSEGRTWIMTAPWIVIFPSLAISSLVVGLNLFADGINETAQRI